MGSEVGRRSASTGRGHPFEYFDFIYSGDVSSQASESTTVVPPDDTEALLDLSRFLDQVGWPTALLGHDGQTVPLPMEAHRVLVTVVASMRSGKAVTIAPLNQRLTTQEAANFLGISRPTLVKLLDRGEISFERPAAGRHRRVRLDEVLEYQMSMRVQRRATLDELTAKAAELGLYQ